MSKGQARALLAVVVLVVIVAMAGKPEQTDEAARSGDKLSVVQKEVPPARVAAGECQVSLAQFMALQTGMSHTQVTRILGCQGTETNRVEYAGESLVMYTWSGTSWISNMNVTMRNGSLIAKAQLGLK